MSFLDNLLGSIMNGDGGKKPDEKQSPQIPGTSKNGTPHAPSQEEAIAANAAVGGSDANKSQKEKEVDIWGAKPAASAITPTTFGETDPAQFNTAVSQMDFMKGIPQDVLQKAQSGDAAAFSQVMQSVAKNSFSASAMSSKALIEQGVQGKVAEIEARMEQKFAEMTGNSAIVKANPAFKDPQVSPIVSMVSKQIRAAYPDASPEELATHAQNMLTSIANKISSGSPEGQAAAQTKQQAAAPQKLLASDWLAS